MSETNGNSILAMASAYQGSENASDLFAKPETPKHEEPAQPSGAMKPKVANTPEHPPIPTPAIDTPAQQIPAENQEAVKNMWVPDAQLTDGMKEFSQQPVTYSKDELKEEDQSPLENIMDDDALQESREAMDELQRKYYNIEDAKRRHGIKYFAIPEGVYQVRVLAAAGDTNYKRAQEHLDDVINEIKRDHPEFILKWVENTQNVVNGKYDEETFAANEQKVREAIDRKKAEGTYDENDPNAIKNIYKELDIQLPGGENNTWENPDAAEGKDPAVELKILIDKRNLSQVSWSQDDVDKIKRSRNIELSIVEEKSISMSQIEDIDDNMIDMVLAPYKRKTNDITASLPASKYRCTFTGLSFPEVMDLSNSTEMDNVDGEMKKWSIAFEHIKNPSIGPWNEYQWYIDPVTKKRVEIGFTDPEPEGIDPESVHVVTKFEDFMMKTSFLDLDFILWKILCATAMDEEIITINCNTMLPNGTTCDKSYDWVYNPNDLLIINSINPAILEDMEKTAKAAGKDEILENYNSSFLNTQNTITLATSGFVVVFGHISAYDYINTVYPAIDGLRRMDRLDPTISSRGLNYILLTMIKEILIPKEGGGYGRVSSPMSKIKIIEGLNEIDWLTLKELTAKVINPYQFRFALRDVVCPSCHNRSIIPIENMLRLLFIVAQSLSSVNVTFKGM